MKPFPLTPELFCAAALIVWFKPPVELLAYAMKHSTDEVIALLTTYYGLDGIKEALDNAPAGIIDPRSWSYWNTKVGRYPAPPLPHRDFDDQSRA